MTKVTKKKATKKTVAAKPAASKTPSPNKSNPVEKVEKTTKYGDKARILLDLKTNKHAKDPKSAMHCIQNAVLNGENTIGKVIYFFMGNWSSPRSTKKNNYSFARGYVIGAIRENYITLK